MEVGTYIFGKMRKASINSPNYKALTSSINYKVAKKSLSKPMNNAHVTSHICSI
jgi:hypothetical protein